jgi:hypothetical protein
MCFSALHIQTVDYALLISKESSLKTTMLAIIFTYRSKLFIVNLTKLSKQMICIATNASIISDL